MWTNAAHRLIGTPAFLNALIPDLGAIAHVHRDNNSSDVKFAEVWCSYIALWPCLFCNRQGETGGAPLPRLDNLFREMSRRPWTWIGLGGRPRHRTAGEFDVQSRICIIKRTNSN